MCAHECHVARVHAARVHASCHICACDRVRPMSCIICLSSAEARRVCSCSARACRGCLLSLLDRGRQRCVVCMHARGRVAGRPVLPSCHMSVTLRCQNLSELFVLAYGVPSCPAILPYGGWRAGRAWVCGSRYQPSAVVRACSFGVRNADAGADPAKQYAKLAVAYSNAGSPRRALRWLAIAQNLASPGTRWYHFIELETAQNLLAIGDAASAERCLRTVMLG